MKAVAVLCLVVLAAAMSSAAPQCNTMCEDIYAPVCGEEFAHIEVTFSNLCELEVYNCMHHEHYHVAYEGPCILRS